MPNEITLKLRFTVACILLLLCAWNCWSLFPVERFGYKNSVQDFSIFYMGSRIVLSGHGTSLYDLSTQARYQTLAYQSHPLPFNHPAYELIPFLSLGSLSFNAAYWAWAATNVILTVVFAILVRLCLPHFPRAGVWAFMACIASFPWLWTLCQGQDSVPLLVIFTGTYYAMKSKKELAGGALLAAGLFKFPLVLPFALPFVLRRWKFVIGFLAAGILFVVISLSVTGLTGAYQYLRLLSLLAAHPQLGYIVPPLMPTIRGFLWTVLANTGIHRQLVEVLSALISALFLLPPILTYRFVSTEEQFDLWFALNVTASLVVSPHLYWHDLTVLLLPLLIVASVLFKSSVRFGFTHVAYGMFALIFMLSWPLQAGTVKVVHLSYFCIALLGFAGWLVFKIRDRPLLYEHAQSSPVST